MMKLTLMITRAEHGGAQTHLATLMKGLAGSREISMVTGEEGYATTVARQCGVTVTICSHLVRRLSIHNDVLAYGAIKRFLHHQRPDLVHAHSSKAGLLGRFAAARLSIPSIFTAHGWAFGVGTSLQRKLIAIPAEKIAGRYTGHVITVSAADYNLAVRYRLVPESRLHLIPNGCPDTPHRAAPGNGAPPHIVSVARFSPPKDYDCLVEALGGLAQPWRASLVGDGADCRRIAALVESLGLGDRIAIPGTIDNVAEKLAGAQIFVLCSRSEGLPISIIEAMRAGLPVVATDVGGVRELVTPECGFLVARGSADEVRTRIALLLKDHRLRERMGAAARRRYETHFTSDRMIARTREVYDQCLGLANGV